MTKKRKLPSSKATIHTPGHTQFTLPVEYDIPDGIVLQYVDNLSISHTETEFVISFFQSQLPSIMGEDDWAKIKKIQSKCVARVVLSPLKMPLFIDAMMKNWNRFLENFGEKVKEDGSEGSNATVADTEPEG